MRITTSDVFHRIKDVETYIRHLLLENERLEDEVNRLKTKLEELEG